MALQDGGAASRACFCPSKGGGCKTEEGRGPEPSAWTGPVSAGSSSRSTKQTQDALRHWGVRHRPTAPCGSQVDIKNKTTRRGYVGVTILGDGGGDLGVPQLRLKRRVVSPGNIISEGGRLLSRLENVMGILAGSKGIRGTRSGYPLAVNRD